MSHVDQPERARLRLDRPNRKLLGVCAGLARYLEVPAALVRVIYCIACLVSPVLLLAYFILYWLLEDEERPGRIKAAVSGFAGTARSPRRTAMDDTASSPEDEAPQRPAAAGWRPADSRSTDARPGTRRFDFFNGGLYRSRKHAWIGGVCGGIADYLGIRPVIVRALTLVSLFVLGGVTVWGYVILWIILDKQPKRRKQSGQAGPAEQPDLQYDLESCAQRLRNSEQRLRNVEAYMTSRQFRLHCEINRI